MLSFGVLCLLLALGYGLRAHVRWLQRLYLPASVVAGLVGLLLLHAVEWPEEMTAGWSRLPSLLINLVFASLFLGSPLPRLSRVWRNCSRQLAYGQIVAWGQYLVGGLLVLLLLGPLFKIPDVFAGIMPVGFEGGHGTAGGLGEVFQQLGYPEMKDYALAAATGGILGAIIVGMGLVNWAIRKGYVDPRGGLHAAMDSTSGVIAESDRPVAGRMTVSPDVIGALSLHLAYVGIAVLIGWLLQQGLIGVGARLPDKAAQVFQSFPLFPLCMLGGVVVQAVADRWDRARHMDRGLMLCIQNGALDFLVVAAIATIQLDVIAAGWVPLVIVIGSGILWNVLCLTLLARRVFKTAWFERGIAEMGQSMGVTATGLLLLRVVDPEYKTEAAEAFASKQLLHEPFMGGGLWTGMAIPLLALWGGWPVVGIAAGAMLLWALFLFLGRR